MYCTQCGSQPPEGATFCASCGIKLQTDAPPAMRPASTTVVPGSKEIATDLRASVEARRELGPDMEDHLVEAFLARLDDRINTRVDEQVAQRVPKGISGAGGRGGGIHALPEPALVVCGSLGLAIPLIGAGGGLSSIPVMIGISLINMFYFVFRHNK